MIRWLRLAAATVSTSLRGLSANRTRAFLSTLGVGIGVATLIAIFALVSGLRTSFAKQFGVLGANTLYVTARPWIIRGDWWKYRNRPKISVEDLTALQRESTWLTAAAPMAFWIADVKAGGERDPGVTVRGTNSDYVQTANVRVVDGRFLSPLDGDLERPVVVIGSEVRERLFRGVDPIGQRIDVKGRWFTVIGVLGPQGKVFGNSLDNEVIIPIGTFLRLFGPKQGLAIAVVAQPGNMTRAEEQIVEILRRSRRLGAGDEDNFSINRQSQVMEVFNEETAAIFGVAIVVGIITLLVGGVGVMNIMLVAVTERTREIGVRRALGARRLTILTQFLLEASLVTMVGGVLGTAAGILGAWLITQVTSLSAAPSAGAAALGFLVSAVVGLLSGTWPAWRASRLDPIESLRYE